jgi:UDP-N-acetylmuramate--alanine ligase
VPADLDLSTPRQVHLVAIGGKAMSAMAELLVAMGHRVSGSDLAEGAEIDRLRQLGVTVAIGHDPSNLGDVDLVACSTAVADDNVERVEALRRGIPVLPRPELQGAIARTLRPVAISGTHGKTTTTAMLVTIAVQAGLDPSYLVGVSVGAMGAAHLGGGDWFVVEADESDGTFLQLGAEIAVVTNVDADHLDRWGSIDAIEAAFDRFLSEATGPTIVGADDPTASRLGAAHGAVSVGTSAGADWRIIDVVVGRGRTRYTLVDPQGSATPVVIPEPGLHNARNSAVAIACAATLGVPVATAVDALAAYPGVERRFQIRGEANGVTVVDDYAHNPAKVAAVLDAAAGSGFERVLAIFQPHRYSRTADLWQQFADSFVAADVAWVTALDPVGEPPRPGVDATLILEAARAAHPHADLRWAPDGDDLLAQVVAEARPGDVCLTIGAGNITRLGGPLLDALREAAG